MPGIDHEAAAHARIRELFLLDGEIAVEPPDAEILGRIAGLFASRAIESVGHLERIGAYSLLLARGAGLSGAETERIRLGAPLHDIGKVAVADEVLRKQGELTTQEREQIERHAYAGYDLLSDSESELILASAEIALSHHERFDGNGYPRGLAGEEIPLAGRVVAIADVFDALICNRPYRDALSLEEAVRIMLRGRGTQFDPELTDAFLLDLDAMLAAASGSADLELALTR